MGSLLALLLWWVAKCCIDDRVVVTSELIRSTMI